LRGGVPPAVVLHKVCKAELNGIRGKHLQKVFKRAYAITVAMPARSFSLALLHRHVGRLKGPG
jgi:hypothetical protein